MESLFNNKASVPEAARRFAKLPTVERRLAGGRMLVQRLDAPTAVSLSGSAPFIWELLDTEDTVDGLTNALQQRYTDERETIKAGVEAALASFTSQDLVEQGPEQ